MLLLPSHDRRVAAAIAAEAPHLWLLWSLLPPSLLRARPSALLARLRLRGRAMSFGVKVHSRACLAAASSS
jgi:hypothetical protein